MADDKIYVGTAKEKTFNDGGSIIKIMLSLDGMKDHFDNYGFTTEQGKKKIKLLVSQRREPDQYGNTHYVTIDTWKPESQATAPEPETPEEEDPFQLS